MNHYSTDISVLNFSFLSKRIGRSCVCMLFVVTLGCSESGEVSSVGIAESAKIIEQAIRREIGKPDGPITDGDRMGVTELHLSNTEITDLTPLAELRDLQGLSLSGCARVRDLSPLEDLPHLVYLDLTKCTAIEKVPDALRKKRGLKVIGP